MAIERRMSRDMFNESAIVELRQTCMTSSGLFEPGKYLVGQLPDAAFEMGLVEALPPTGGKREDIDPTSTDPTPDETDPDG